MPDFLFRPVKLKDLEGLHALIKSMKSGLASLPDDTELLKKRIKKSQYSFKRNVQKPGLQSYLFVLEEVQTQKIVGVSGIHAKSTISPYFYVFEQIIEKHKSRDLNVELATDAIKLKKIKDSPAEVCSLYLNEEYRRMGIAPLLSFARYLFIKNNPHRFPKKIIANLRGQRDAKGKSPFWRAVAKPFIQKDLTTVDAMKSLGHKAFIEDLMPKQPIYTHLLPEEARDCIGKVHPNTEAALHLLLKQGFKVANWIDIFDGAPYLLADLKNVQAYKNSTNATIGTISDDIPIDSKNYIISTTTTDFRATISPLQIITNSKVIIPKETASLLQLTEGTKVSYIPV